MGDNLPLLIPLGIVEAALLIYVLHHIMTHQNYKRGNRLLWGILAFVTFIGPIAYLIFGKEDD